jgi:two-component system sensor histidine kinase/response regulator
MSPDSEAQISGSLARPDEVGVAPGQPDGPLILVVDDGPVNRTVMSAMLETLGYRVDLATNGSEAVDATRRERYAAVLMDCLMPVMDGYEATATIRREERENRTSGVQRHVPIIAVTAVAIEGIRERCIAAGMDDFLSKPVLIQSVGDVLKRWVMDAGAAATWTPELATAPVVAEEQPIDWRALDAIRELDPQNERGLLADIVREFGAEVTPRFDTLKVAVASGDLDTVLGELHFIAGCASLVGATDVERLARSIESLDPAETDSGPLAAETRVERLEAAFIRARTMLESIAVSSPPAP